jgi:hypothetical protein
MAKRKQPGETGKLELPEGHEGPWRHQAPGVKGVASPGRRLSDDARERVWHATGVKGIKPPGTQEVGKGAAADWVNRKSKKPTPPARKNKADKAQGAEPKLKEFLDRMADFIVEHRPEEAAMLDLSRDMHQTHAPFEIIVGFTLLSALVGDDESRRRQFHLALERGAKAYYNLARRLDKSVRPPRGLVPQTLDPLFYDLPDMAYQMPLPFSTHAFCGLLDFLRGGPEQDRALIAFANTLRSETVEGKRFGDQTLEQMFPWDLPDWAPDD